MTPPASSALWRTGAERARNVRRTPRALKLAMLVLVGVPVAIAVALYMGGSLFLWSQHSDPRRASPLTLARYAYYYERGFYGERPEMRKRLLLCAGAGVAALVLPTLVLVLPRRRALHGSARFAHRREIAAAGMLGEHGLILGQVGGIAGFGARYLRLPGQQGVSLSAQPRAGKGVGVVIPNLLSWPGSVVCVDIKRENWTLTAGYRAACGQQTFLFDPLSPHTHRWNLLDFIPETPHGLIDALQLHGNMLFPDPINTDPFWMASARSLFLGIGLYVFSTPGMPRTIGQILRLGMANDEEGFSQHWRRVIQGRMSGRHPLPEQCVRALSDVIDLAPQTASSIRKTFTSKLELWTNPLLDAATASSDFDLRELRKRPMSIYLGVNPKDLHRLQPLLSLFFQQSIALQTDELPEHNPALRHQVLMLLDEFPALGRIPIIEEASGFLPGYNVRTLLVMQTPAQLREVYGENGAKILLKTLAGRIYFAPKDMEEAEEISRELGATTVKVRTLSKPLFDLADTKSRRGRSVNVSEQKRALMLPQEVREMGARRQIVFAEGLPPILCKKIRYYAIAELRRRVQPPPHVPAIEPYRAPVEGGPSSRAGLVGAGAAQNAVAEGRPHTREATLEDIERLETLTLEDFAAPLDQIVIPQKAEGERLTHEELQEAVESFLQTLKQGE